VIDNSIVELTCIGLTYIQNGLRLGSDFSFQAYMLERWAALLRYRKAREFWLPDGGHG
jgi:hypothetical protein